jgi:hypothetical protein
VIVLLSASTAHAQLFRSYLASTGSDSNPCTLQAPCRLLPAALTAVAAGGEIWMLDSANYNTAPVTVAKSVTILAVPGALGSVVAAGGDALNIGGSSIKVALRNLVIGPLPGGGGNNGVVLGGATELVIENCLIAGLPGSGVFTAFPASVQVTDSTIRDNGVHGVIVSQGARATITRSDISGNSFYGVFVSAAGTPTFADIADSTMAGNAIAGVWLRSNNLDGTIKVSVHGNRISQSGTAVGAGSDAGGAVTLSVTDNVIANNSNGVAGDSAGTRVFVSGNTIIGNLFGLRTTGAGVIESAGNNALYDNNTDTSGTITVIATKRGTRQ